MADKQLSLATAITEGRLEDFIRQEEARGVLAISAEDFDAVLAADMLVAGCAVRHEQRQQGKPLHHRAPPRGCTARPMPRARERNIQNALDAPRTRRHDDESIRKQYGLIDTMRDE